MSDRAPRPFPPDPLSYFWTAQPYAGRPGYLGLLQLMDLDAYVYAQCSRDKWPPLFTPGDKETGCMLKWMTYRALHRKRRKQFPMYAWHDNPFDWPFSSVHRPLPPA